VNFAADALAEIAAQRDSIRRARIFRFALSGMNWISGALRCAAAGLTNHFNRDGIVNQVGADEVQLAQADLGMSMLTSSGAALVGWVWCRSAMHKSKAKSAAGRKASFWHLVVSKNASAWPADAPTAMGLQYPRFRGPAMKKCKVGVVGWPM